MLDRYPELNANDEVLTWLEGVRRRWIGNVSTTRYDGRGWLVLTALAGPLPEDVAEVTISLHNFFMSQPESMNVVAR